VAGVTAAAAPFGLPPLAAFLWGALALAALGFATGMTKLEGLFLKVGVRTPGL
jgi:hypothetical protein